MTCNLRHCKNLFLIPANMAQKSLIIKKFLFGYKMVNHLVLLIRRDVYSRYRQMFFDQVGHQTMSAYIENKHFFTKSCHRQTYQNYEQPPKSLQNFYFQSHFSASNFFFFEEYLTRRSTFINETFCWLCS